MAMKYICRNISMLKYNEYNIIHFDDLIKNITNPDNDNNHYIRKVSQILIMIMIII